MNGLLLVNLGSPVSPKAKDVKVFLHDFLQDPNVVTMPQWLWKPILNSFVLPFRSKHSAKLYQDIWTENGSPLTYYTYALMRSVQKIMPHWQVKIAMTYGQPDIASSLKQMKENGCKQIVVLPLFPEYTLSTTKSIQEQVAQSGVTVKFIPSFYRETGFQNAYAAKVQQAWNQKDYDFLYISYHGIPIQEIKQGDPYLKECEEATQLLLKRLQIPKNKVKMVFQSKFGPMPWLQPYLQQSLIEGAKAGQKKVLIATASFITDCLETIEEDGVENKKVFLQNGGSQLDLVPSLNDDPQFCKFIATLADEQLKNN